MISAQGQNSLIWFQPKVKDVGGGIDSSFAMCDHISSVCRSACLHWELRRVGAVRSFLTVEAACWTGSIMHTLWDFPDSSLLAGTTSEKMMMMWSLMSSDVGLTYYGQTDQWVSMVQSCFTSTETIRLIRTGSPWRSPPLSHSSWTLWKDSPTAVKVQNHTAKLVFRGKHNHLATPILRKLHWLPVKLAAFPFWYSFFLFFFFLLGGGGGHSTILPLLPHALVWKWFKAHGLDSRPSVDLDGVGRVEYPVSIRGLKNACVESTNS